MWYCITIIFILHNKTYPTSFHHDGKEISIVGFTKEKVLKGIQYPELHKEVSAVSDMLTKVMLQTEPRICMYRQ